MKVLAFGATNSKESINKKLVKYATTLTNSDNIEILDLNDYEMKIYSVDREKESGIPDEAKKLFNKIGSADLIIISFAEYNGSYTSAYKNIFDWMSRIDMKVFQNKKVIYLSTSGGQFGAASVLKSATDSIGYFAGNLVGSMSLPSYYENFNEEKNEIINEEFNNKLKEIISKI